MSRAINEIMAERARQNDKWGQQNHGPSRWFLILSEEVGELAMDILENSRGVEPPPPPKFEYEAATLHPEIEDKIRGELVQVAAVAVAWLECIDRRKGADHDSQS